MRCDVQTTLRKLNGMFRVKAGRGWLNWLLKIGIVLRGGNTSAVARSAVVCMRHFQQIYKTQGMNGLVLRTKSLYILTMQSVGGHVIHSPRSLGPAVGRTTSGLPRVIPAEHRRRIRNGDRFILRLWLSWFSIYRVLTIPGKLKINTITDPGVTIPVSLWREACTVISEFVSYLGYAKIGSALPKLSEVRFFPLSKSTPVLRGKGRKMSGSIPGIYFGLHTLRHSEVWPSFVQLMQVLPKRASFVKAIDALLEAEPVYLQSPYVGKLGFKLEAAGKVRVFAMVDCWTQWLLWPIHQFVMNTVAKLPSDGSFDQLRPIHRLIEAGKTRFWCYDLSAATDRLPSTLQAHILDHLLGDGLGLAWRELLVGRSYQVPKLPSGVVKVDIPESVRYAVGQPMGALSSWAMLALTHHLIVHWAARRVGHKVGSFWDYAVLGDDIVIADGRVAGAYLQLMESLGVGIGVHKSLVSRKGVLEFAKRFFCQGVDCSPVPFKEMVAGHLDFEFSTEFITKYKLGARSIAAFMGYGYRTRGRLSADFSVLPKKLGTVGIWRASPWGPLELKASQWLKVTSYVIRPEWLTPGVVSPRFEGPHPSWPHPDPNVKVSTTFTIGFEGDPVGEFLDCPDFVKRIKEFAIKDDKRLEELFDKAPRGDSLVFAVPRLRKWIDSGLLEQVALLPVQPYWGYRDLVCEALREIQSALWRDSVPMFRKDIREAKDVAYALRIASPLAVHEYEFLNWVTIRQKGQRLSQLPLLGEKPRLRSYPSVLFPARLYRYARK